MATLHLVSKARALTSCLECAAEEDAVLLMEDGVYAAIQTHPVTMHVLIEDARKRGVAGKLASGCRLVNYEQFVDLVTEHKPIVSWR